MTIKKDDGNWQKPFKHSLVNGIFKKKEFGTKLGKRLFRW